MAKHCDFCMEKIDNDPRAVKITREYVQLFGINKTTRPALNPRTELCGDCHKRTSDAIGMVMANIFEDLPEGTQELITRLKS